METLGPTVVLDPRDASSIMIAGPTTLQQLSACCGLSEEKIVKWGESILRCVNAQTTTTTTTPTPMDLDNSFDHDQYDSNNSHDTNNCDGGQRDDGTATHTSTTSDTTNQYNDGAMDVDMDVDVDDDNGKDNNDAGKCEGCTDGGEGNNCAGGQRDDGTATHMSTTSDTTNECNIGGECGKWKVGDEVAGLWNKKWYKCIVLDKTSHKKGFHYELEFVVDKTR